MSFAIEHPRLVVVFVTLFAMVTFGMTAELAGGPAISPGASDVVVIDAGEDPPGAHAGGPPPCLGFTIDDPCITPKALGECRAAVAQCGDGPVAVVLTCPLQFVCGK